MRRKYKKIRRSGVLYDYTPIGIVVVSIMAIVLLLASSLLLYVVRRYGRSTDVPMLSAMVGLH